MPRAAPYPAAALIAAAVWLLSTGCPSVSNSDLEAWGLPLDLAQHIDTIEELELSGDVDRLGWLRPATRLRALSLRSTRVATLAEVPDSVESLSLIDQAVAFHGLPDGLISLRVANDEIAGLADAISGVSLDSLRLEGRLSGRPLVLPAALRRLALIDPGVDLRDLALPELLQELEYEGRALGTLDDLPPAVSHLTLRRTSLSRLPNLGPSLRVLVLDANGDLTIDRLPRLLTHLTLNGQEPLEQPPGPYLESLGLLATRLAEIELLPPSLQRVELRPRSEQDAVDVGAILQRCPQLEELTFDGRYVRNFDAALFADRRLQRLEIFLPPERLILSPGLRELSLQAVGRLEMTGAAESVSSLSLQLTDLRSLELVAAGESTELTELLASMPRLTSLSLAMSDGDRLPALPARLLQLDLSGARFDDWNTPLPEGLQTLRLAGAKIGELPALPKTLRVLDISRTAVEFDRLPALPELRELTIHPGQLRHIGDDAAQLTILRIVPRNG